MSVRPTCGICNINPVALNYYKDGKAYWRKSCRSCIKAKRKKAKEKPRWQRAGYKKLPKCERCGFVAKYPAQLSVFFVDGNMNNINITNLKTICANCKIGLDIVGHWDRGGLTPDF